MASSVRTCPMPVPVALATASSLVHACRKRCTTLDEGRGACGASAVAARSIAARRRSSIATVVLVSMSTPSGPLEATARSSSPPLWDRLNSGPGKARRGLPRDETTSGARACSNPTCVASTSRRAMRALRHRRLRIRSSMLSARARSSAGRSVNRASRASSIDPAAQRSASHTSMRAGGRHVLQRSNAGKQMPR